MTGVTCCGSCGDRRLTLVLDLGVQPLPERDNGERYPLRLLRCVNCTLVQLSHIADQAEMFPPDHPYRSGNTRALRDHFAGLARKVASVTGPGDLVADIGCNDGTLLDAVRHAADVRVLGVEPTGQAEKCRARGIGVERAFFTAALGETLRERHGPAKVITACNVFAHVPDPHNFLDGVLAWLGDDGTVIFENHDWGSIANGLQVDTVYHEHARYYSAASLSHLLASHGLLVSEAVPVPVHGGSLRVSAVREQPHLPARASTARSVLRGILAEAAGAGPVYGIGATTRAAPLIHWADIGQWITCVCEVPGSEKIGQHIPGTSIPVVDETELIAHQPPYALLLAWHITGTVVPALRAAGYRGKFIQPLPEAVILDR